MNLGAYASKLLHNVKERFDRRRLKPYMDKLQDIRKLDCTGWSDAKLQEASARLRERARGGEPPDALLVEAFALAVEAASRTLGLRPFDVQIMAGAALHAGNMVEMRTGEGKTLAAVLPAYLHALQGRGVHVLTFNDYLAGRDAGWMGPVYAFLGVTVGHVGEGMSIAERQRAYACDITYVTAKEAGFDFLRDTIALEPGQIVHRPFHYAIVDEADSILIDEARVPLVIAGEVAAKGGGSARYADMAGKLEQGKHFDFDENRRNVFLTEAGVEFAETLIGSGNLYDERNNHHLTLLNCALHAETLLKRDVDYVVRDGKLELIDAYTGRIAENRHWPDGLQAAVEAKEGMASQASGKILGTITLQHLLSQYPLLSGMTATAVESANEFRNTYNLTVVQIPPNLPNIRVDEPNRIYTHKEAKLKALVAEIAAVHATGRPILIGTSSVEESDELAESLKRAGVACHVLNARNDTEEAAVIARAGVPGAVTVSTNMAGRGVDIRLGAGEPEMARRVAALGGLYVIGTHMNESARIDNQLRGRAGRQGDPGSSRFYVCLEDELINRFGIEKALPAALRGRRQDAPLEEAAFNRKMEHIQRVVMGQNYELRQSMNKYADMVEDQRKMIHETRHALLYGEAGCSPVERRVRLHHLDLAWADHLAYVAYIREGIHLESLANRNPIDEFHHRIIEAYDKIAGRIDRETAATLSRMGARANARADEIDWSGEGLKGPSRTWTYLIQDQYQQKKVNIFSF